MDAKTKKSNSLLLIAVAAIVVIALAGIAFILLGSPQLLPAAPGAQQPPVAMLGAQANASPMPGSDSALGRNSPPTLVGGDRDAHGCIPSAGYTWCDATQKCYRPFEEKCPTVQTPSTTGNSTASPMPASPPSSGNASATPPASAASNNSSSAPMQNQPGLIPIVNSNSSVPAISNATPESVCMLNPEYNWCSLRNACIKKTTTCAPSVSTLNDRALVYCGTSGVSSVSLCGDYVKVVRTDVNSIVFYSSTSTYSCPSGSQDAQCKLMLSADYCQEIPVC